MFLALILYIHYPGPLLVVVGYSHLTLRGPQNKLRYVAVRLGRDAATRNLYLVCRMFWCDDVVNSNVCWGTSNPKFNFAQVRFLVLLFLLIVILIANNASSCSTQ